MVILGGPQPECRQQQLDTGIPSPGQRKRDEHQGGQKREDCPELILLRRPRLMLG